MGATAGGHGKLDQVEFLGSHLQPAASDPEIWSVDQLETWNVDVKHPIRDHIIDIDEYVVLIVMTHARTLRSL